MFIAGINLIHKPKLAHVFYLDALTNIVQDKRLLHAVIQIGRHRQTAKAVRKLHNKTRGKDDHSLQNGIRRKTDTD